MHFPREAVSLDSDKDDDGVKLLQLGMSSDTWVFSHMGMF